MPGDRRKGASVGAYMRACVHIQNEETRFVRVCVFGSYGMGANTEEKKETGAPYRSIQQSLTKHPPRDITDKKKAIAEGPPVV